MKVQTLRFFAIVVSLASLSVAAGQQSDNPFKGQSGDPFGAKPVEPIAGQQPDRDPRIAEAKAQQERAFLERSLVEVRLNNENLRKKINTIEPQFDAISLAHNRLIGKLLSSDDQTIQLAGLEHILTCRNERVPLMHDDTITASILRLVESDSAKIRESSTSALIRYDQYSARESGFQSGFWFPLRDSLMARSIESRLMKIAAQDFVFPDVPLSEVVHELNRMCDFPISIEEGVDVNLRVSCTAMDERLHASLDKLLAAQNLTYKIGEHDLIILPIDSPNATTSATYNVRGLLTDHLDIQAIAKVARESLKKSGGNAVPEDQVLVLDRNRLSITGTDSQKFAIAESFWELGRGR